MKRTVFLLILGVFGLLDKLTTQAADVSVGVGFGFYPHRHYCHPYPFPHYYFRPRVYYYYAPPPPVYYRNYDVPDPEDWPDEKAEDRQDHGGFITGKAWAALADGRFAEAEDRFSDKIDDHPSLGIPRIGHALTVARMGDLPYGSWQMHVALHYDPEAMNDVPENELLDAKLDHLIQRYEDVLDRNERAADPAFMLAALHYLRGHLNSARKNIDIALRFGDDSVAARNLNDLIDRKGPAPGRPKAAPRAAPEPDQDGDGKQGPASPNPEHPLNPFPPPEEFGS